MPTRQREDDTQGNILGERGTFNYIAGDGQVYNMIQDVSVASGVGNVFSSDPAQGKLTTSQRLGIKARYVLLEGVDDPRKKKRVVIGDPASAIMTGANTTATINGVVYRVATIVGERRSLPRTNPPVIPPE